MPCKLAIPTMSLGHCSAGHSLETKLDALQANGYHGIELTFEDLESVARRHQHRHHHGHSPVTSDNSGASDPLVPLPPDQAAAALEIRTMCRDRNLTIISLQSFMQYEGLIDRHSHELRFAELLNWIKLARLLGTDMIMIPASSLPPSQVSPSIDLIVRDLQRAADAGRTEHPHVRFAYEARFSATRIDRWEFCWDVVERVRRSNFGMCLDTFHLACAGFADPSVLSGRVPDGDGAVAMSMRRLVKRLRGNIEKVFLVQMGDARLPNEPIAPGGPEDETPRSVWSLKYRLFYGEVARGAYLPVREVADAIFNGIEYDGWVSLELFNDRMACGEPGVPADLVRRGAVSWKKLADDMGWWPLAGSKPM